MQTYLPNNNDIADYYYFLLNDLLYNTEAIPGERLLHLKEHLSEFFKEISKYDNQFFSNDFARLIFILDSNQPNPSLSFKVKQIYFFLKKINRNNLKKFTNNDLSECIFIFSLLVKDKTGVILPDSLSNLYDEISFNITVSSSNSKFSDRMKFLRGYVKSIDKKKKEIHLAIEGIDDDVLFYPLKDWAKLLVQVRIGSTLNLIDVVKKDGALFTSNSSLIVLEPDYLFDATEMAEAFDLTGFNPYRLLLKRIHHHSESIHLVVGHIVNHMFDAIIINPSVEFEELYLQALKSRVIALFSVVIDNQENKKLIREKSLSQFNNLKQIVNKNNFGKIAIEPSFISPLYGFQGRMDLLVEDRDNNIKKDIYELKSGSPAKIDTGFTKDGSFIKTGTFVNHFAQVTVYNMLLETCYPTRKGSSAILYSKDDFFPLRNVPNFKAMQREMIQARNDYMDLEYKLSEGDESIFQMLDAAKFPNASYWVKDDFSNFSNMYINLSEVLRRYYTIWIKFISNELFAVKIGKYGRGDGYAGLWRRSLESKELSGDLISGMKLVTEETDFEAMHLAFSYTTPASNISQFKKGDMCIIYPEVPDSEYTPSRGRLIKCSIKNISSDKVVLSLRNKLQYEIFANPETNWFLDFDSTDSSVKSLFKSLSHFINSSDDKKKMILGLMEPKFSNQKCLPPAYLSKDKIRIYQSAMNAEDYFIIQGPPGTGKTKYMLRALVEGISNHTDQNILLLAYTNRAVDEICDAMKLIQANDDNAFEFIRLGNKESSVHKEYLLSELVESEDLNSLFKKIKRTRVFAATVSFAISNNELFSLKYFHTAIVDEAAQITECNLVGILARVDKFILIGDEKQLPAIVIQDELKLNVNDELLSEIGLNYLNISLFERLLYISKKKCWNSSYSILNQQARMHLNVMEFPNRYFYDGQLEVFDLDKQNEEEKIFKSQEGMISKILTDNRVAFINTPVEFHPKYNLVEVDLVINILRCIKNTYGESFDESKVGVISPFRLQCASIRKKMSGKERELISVDTVERFQGSERDIIIISTAINNSYLMNNAQSLIEIDGKLIDRKLNVAITRAKFHVVILGNETMLRSSYIYSELIDFCKSKKTFFNYNQIVELDSDK